MDVSLVDSVWMSHLETLYENLVWILCMGTNIPCMCMDIPLGGGMYIVYISRLDTVYYTSRGYIICRVLYFPVVYWG